MSLCIQNQHNHLKTSLPCLRKNVRRALEALKLKNTALDIALVNDLAMRRLNFEQRNVSTTTDVLSFPSIQPGPDQVGVPRVFSGIFLGDVIISLDVAQKQALAQHISLSKEVTFLIIHSLLHLLGYDHDTQKKLRTMQAVESRIWRMVALSRT
ncbi:MAG TPA: rRNA maturation RNase YbeY [bacterium]|nr:rRNA maturation RNase YbeY [bacterium]